MCSTGGRIPGSTGAGVMCSTGVCPRSTGAGVMCSTGVCPWSTGAGVMCSTGVCPRSTGAVHIVRHVQVVTTMIPQDVLVGVRICTGLCHHHIHLGWDSVAWNKTADFSLFWGFLFYFFCFWFFIHSLIQASIHNSSTFTFIRQHCFCPSIVTRIISNIHNILSNVVCLYSASEHNQHS